MSVRSAERHLRATLEDFIDGTVSSPAMVAEVLAFNAQRMGARDAATKRMVPLPPLMAEINAYRVISPRD